MARWRCVIFLVLVVFTAAYVALANDADDKEYMTESGEIKKVSEGEIMTDSGKIEEVGDGGEYMTDSGEVREVKEKAKE